MMTKEQHNKISNALMYLKEMDDSIGDLRQASIDLGWRAANPSPDYGPNNTVMDSMEFKAYEDAHNEVWDIFYNLKLVLTELSEEEVITGE